MARITTKPSTKSIIFPADEFFTLATSNRLTGSVPPADEFAITAKLSLHVTVIEFQINEYSIF